MNATPTLPALLESYFTQRLMAQRQSQSTYDCLLPGHIPFTLELCA